MLFTAILDKAAKSARRFQVAGLHSGIDVPLRDRRSTPGWPLPHPAKTAAAPPFEPAELEHCRELQQLHRVFVKVGVQRARMSTMAMVAYRVAPTGEKWLVTRDGEPGMSYISQEAAHEVAVAEASGDLRTGHEIRIEVVGDAYDRAGDGSPTLSPTSPQE